MIHFHRVLFSLVACLAVAGFSGAQPTPSLSIPQALKTGTVDNDGKEKIKAFVAAQFKKMVSPDAAADPQKAARDAREALAQDAKAGSQPASPEYQAAYTEAVAAEAKAAFTGTKDVRVKLNIAIVLAKVAENAPQSRLEPAISMLLADADSVPFQVWGIRAARYVMPDLVKIGSAGGLITRIAAIAKANPSGPLTEEAYEALKPSTDPKSIAALVDPLLTLAEVRIAKLQAGYAEDPFCDYKPFYALAQNGVWDKIPTAQRVRTMQLMVNVLAWGSYRADEQKGPMRDQLGVLLNKSAGSLFVMASITAETTTIVADKAPAGSLASLAKNLAETTGGINIATIGYTKSCSLVVPAIALISEFAAVKVTPATAMSGGGAGE